MRDGLRRLNISFVNGDISGEYKDPNEALTGNRAAFEAAIQNAQAQTAARPDNTSYYIDRLMQGEMERLQAAAERKTGFETLDLKSGGLYSGLYVIAATSSLGKTTFSLQIADNLAAAGNEVLFFSMEQSRLELVSKSFARIMAQKDRATAVSSLAIRKGAAPAGLADAVAKYKQDIGERLSIIEGNFGCNVSFIGDYVRDYIRRNECRPIVIVDYLQILQPADDAKRLTARESIDNTVTALKRISRELELTVIVISSVNRANYLAPIDFESLKESGGIEYTADVIWGLQLQCLNEALFDDPQKKLKEKRARIREEKARNPRRVELLCLKNRYGVANFTCSFDYYPAHDLFVQSEFFEDYDDEDNPYSSKQPVLQL
jgi:dnaB domain protein helicase domain protein